MMAICVLKFLSLHELNWMSEFKFITQAVDTQFKISQWVSLSLLS